MRFSSWSWNSGPALYPPQGAGGFMGVCPTSPHVLCGSGEGIRRGVPRGILWGVLREYGVRGPLLRAVRSLYDRSRSLFALPAAYPGAGGSPGLGTTGFHLCFLQMMLSCWLHSSQDLQHVLERFAAECEAAGMRISTSKSEAMVLDRKRVACPLRVGGEVLPQVEEFKYLGSCSRVRERWSVRLTGGLVQRPQLCGRCTGPSW
ncbi:hypothetical protein L3Q82_002481 [Scortum barcoo]|uniref:Uncharacterized protein n=1 Tax=Scortum barcoo TaxID=214431 RepID=A0ACB8VYV0_9TELE|nr:hypothetical protein L3Q82_002481 [Scortum barcoo]